MSGGGYGFFFWGGDGFNLKHPFSEPCGFPPVTLLCEFLVSLCVPKRDGAWCLSVLTPPPLARCGFGGGTTLKCIFPFCP